MQSTGNTPDLSRPMEDPGYDSYNSDAVPPQGYVDEYSSEDVSPKAFANDYNVPLDDAPKETVPQSDNPPKKQVSMSSDIYGYEDHRPESELSSHPSEAGPARPRRMSQAELNAADKKRKRMLRASQMPSQYTVGGNLKKKHYLIRFCKCGGMMIFVIGAIFVLSFFLLYGFRPEEESDPEPEEPSYDIQEVLPGRLQALSLSGTVAAIQDDFDVVQIYNHTGSSEAPFWTRMGQPFSVDGDVSLSGNGTVVAFVSKADRRPHVLGFDPDKNIWLEQDSPLIICDELSMDVDATVLTVGVYNRLDIGAWQDFIVSFTFDGAEWKEFANRLELGTIDTLSLSPTGRFMLVTTIPETGDLTPILNTFRLTVEQDEPEWEKVALDRTLDDRGYSVALAEDVYALETGDVLNVFSYSGRVWGQDLFPSGNSTFGSVAMSVDGRTVAVSEITGNTTGVVYRYTFPWTADTGDDWEDTGPPLEYDWQLDEQTLRDEFGKEAPVFGTTICLDGDGSTIAVQSGLEGRQNVHFYDVVISEEDEDEEDE